MLRAGTRMERRLYLRIRIRDLQKFGTFGSRTALSRSYSMTASGGFIRFTVRTHAICSTWPIPTPVRESGCSLCLQANQSKLCLSDLVFRGTCRLTDPAGDSHTALAPCSATFIASTRTETHLNRSLLIEVCET